MVMAACPVMPARMPIAEIAYRSPSRNSTGRKAEADAADSGPARETPISEAPRKKGQITDPGLEGRRYWNDHQKGRSGQYDCVVDAEFLMGLSGHGSSFSWKANVDHFTYFFV